MDGLPNFLTHGAPLARFARRNSAINEFLKTEEEGEDKVLIKQEEEEEEEEEQDRRILRQ